MIDLTPFCDPNSLRFDLTAPFSDEIYTYSADGNICIRIPRRTDVPISAFAANPAELFAKAAAHWTGLREWFAIPQLPGKKIKPCPECDHGCAECDRGWIECQQSVDIGDSFFARKYLRMLTALPGIKISPDDQRVASFKFDGGAGLLMPMSRRV